MELLILQSSLLGLKYFFTKSVASFLSSFPQVYTSIEIKLVFDNVWITIEDSTNATHPLNPALSG